MNVQQWTGFGRLHLDNLLCVRESGQLTVCSATPVTCDVTAPLKTSALKDIVIRLTLRAAVPGRPQSQHRPASRRHCGQV